MKNTKYSELSNIQKKLIDSAESVLKNSYSPYSKFAVAAAVLTDDDQIITGVNFENASYGMTTCAENVAITTANTLGKRTLKAIAIISKSKDVPNHDVTAPCGKCRQIIFESSQISNTDIEVIMSNSAQDKVLISGINELLPLAFGPKDLGV